MITLRAYYPNKKAVPHYRKQLLQSHEHDFFIV